MKDKKLIEELKDQYLESDKDIKKLRDDSYFSWDKREEIVLGIVGDANSRKTKSQVNTQDLMNLVIDGACRVMAQFPTGKVQAITKDDAGKNVLMDTVIQNYIIPNANAQYDLMTKMRMWNIYSRVYGSMPALIDYRIDKDYVGPDFWLIHPRNFFYQAGCTSINDMAYCQISTWVSIKWLEQRNKEVWKNINKLIREAKNSSSTRFDQDEQMISLAEREKNDLSSEKGKNQKIEIRTRYEKTRWITYAPEFNLILRDIPNPHGNNELPIVMKHCFPLIDRLYGLGEIERGWTLQFAANSLVNMYLDGVKMSIRPPLILNKNGIVSSSITYNPGAKWLTTQPNSISELNLSPQGLNTFQSTYSFLKAAILNMGATTDTSVAKETEQAMGKTPQALKMQASREGARDNWDREMMEQSIEQVYNKMIDLMTTKQETPIDITLFGSEIEKIQKAYPNENIMELFDSQDAGKISVSPDMWGKNVKYKFFIDGGSTMKADDEQEHQKLVSIIELVLKIPGAVQQISETGKFRAGDKEFNFGEALHRFISSAGIKDGEKICDDVQEDPEQQMQEDQKTQMLEKQVQELTQMVQELAPQVQKLTEKPQKPLTDYRSAPEEVKRQMEQADGFRPAMGANANPEMQGFIQQLEEQSPTHPLMNNQQ